MNKLIFDYTGLDKEGTIDSSIFDFLFDEFELVCFEGYPGMIVKLNRDEGYIQISGHILESVFDSILGMAEIPPIRIKIYTELADISEGKIPVFVDEDGDLIIGDFAVPASLSKQFVEFWMDKLLLDDKMYINVSKAFSYVFATIQEIQERSMARQKIIKAGNIAKHKYSREHRLSTSNNKIWLFEDIVQYTCDNYIKHPNSHQIHCPCWDVRGHYRHYKSGKVVFIPSYRKGKQRDKIQPKDKEYYT